MPIMIKCKINDEETDIKEALKLRNEADDKKVDKPNYLCIKCNQPVRPHKAGGNTKAHFEHKNRNPECPFFVRRNNS